MNDPMKPENDPMKPASEPMKPASEPMKKAWTDVEERLSALGRVMKESYRGAAEGEPVDDDAAGDDEQESGAALRHAFDRLAAAGREVGERIADVARDDDVKTQARQAAAALNDALSTTANVIGEHVGGLFKRNDKGASETDAPRPDPAADGPERAQSAENDAGSAGEHHQ